MAKDKKTEAELKSEENLTNKRKGRPKGSKNLITKSAKEAFHFAFEKAGGAARLARYAKSGDVNYGRFMQLYSKLIPVDLTTQEEKVVIKEFAEMSDKDIIVLMAKMSAALNPKK